MCYKMIKDVQPVVYLKVNNFIFDKKLKKEAFVLYFTDYFYYCTI